MPLKRFCKTCDIFGLKFGILALVVIGLSVFLASCVSFKHLTAVTEQSFPQAAQCKKCHVEIYNEWAGSDHSSAYKNESFRQATDNYSFENCLSCHAPQPGVTDAAPITRMLNRDEGVTCVSCHLEEGKLSGPIEPTGKVAPHPIGVNPDFYKGSSICGSCHKSDFAEWEKVKADDKKSCQQCHMPQVTRKVTQATGGISNIIVALEHEVLQKKHDFSIISSKTEIEIISIQAKKNDSSATLKITNNLPHSLPSGDFGFRSLLLEALAINSKGNETRLGQIELVKESKSSIPPSGSLDWQLKISPDTVFIRIKLTRLSYQKDDAIILADIKASLQ